MTPQPTPTYGPYSPVRQSGNTYFVSGQIGLDPATKTTTPDAAGQTRQVLENLTKVLTSAGLGLNDVVKTTVYLTDMSDFADMNEVYIKYFQDPRPARSCVAVAELPRVANHPLQVEIEAIASKI